MVYYVYILASRPYGTLYVGVTNDLVRRVYEHREGLAEGFTKRHGVKSLVYFEPFDSIELAIRREKSVKRWSRAWKIELIERSNPQWIDLWSGVSRWLTSPFESEDLWLGMAPGPSHGSRLALALLTWPG